MSRPWLHSSCEISFYRIQPDHRFPPIYEDDIHFNGDGAVTAIRIEGGHVDFKQRFVRTDRFVHETKARKALFGRVGWIQFIVVVVVVLLTEFSIVTSIRTPSWSKASSAPPPTPTLSSGEVCFWQ